MLIITKSNQRKLVASSTDSRTFSTCRIILAPGRHLLGSLSSSSLQDIIHPSVLGETISPPRFPQHRLLISGECHEAGSHLFTLRRQKENQALRGWRDGSGNKNSFWASMKTCVQIPRSQVKRQKTGEMVQWVEVLSVKPDLLEERINSSRLSSDLHVCIVTRVCTYLHT